MRVPMHCLIVCFTCASLFGLLLGVVQLLHYLPLVSSGVVSVGVVARLLLGPAFARSAIWWTRGGTI